MVNDAELLRRAELLIENFKRRGLTLATAESCTGGLAIVFLTEIAGASKVVDSGFVTYSNAAKKRLLGVPSGLLDEHGAVSEPVARAMAENALERTGSDVAVSVTGVAGPAGGTPDKPVGLVHFGAARRDGPTLHREKRFGDLGRSMIRRESVATLFEFALEMAAG